MKGKVEKSDGKRVEGGGRGMVRRAGEKGGRRSRTGKGMEKDEKGGEKEEKRRRKGVERDWRRKGKGKGNGEGKGSGKGAEKEKKGIRKECKGNGPRNVGKGWKEERLPQFFVYPLRTMFNISCQIAWLPRHHFLVQWGCSHSWGLQLANGTG